MQATAEADADDAGPSSSGGGEIDDIFGDFAAKKKAAVEAKQQQSEKAASAHKRSVKKGNDAFDSMMADTSGEGSGKKRKFNPLRCGCRLPLNKCVFHCREIHRGGLSHLYGGGTED